MATQTPNRESTTKQGHTVRVTVKLTEKAYRDLLKTVELTDLNKTDTINRAIRVHAWMTDVIENGGNIYVEEKPGADLLRVKTF
ncbi:hypothetical protein [Streptomyces chartreusis]|uniref:hypothetical protein n=1 Tax=Streptomyces chartreusis TaxID=1969 RepID=UPI0037B4E6AE